MTQPDVVNLWPDDCPHGRDVEGDVPRMDVYRPAASGGDRARAAMVVLPGGGYTHRAEHEGRPFAELFARHGMVGIICHYRVGRRFPASYTDACRAIRLVRARAAEWHIDPQRVGLLGFSAGGHNACTVATQPELQHDSHDDLAGRFSARPDRLALAYAVTSFGEYGHEGSCEALLGPDATAAQRDALDGEAHVDERTPPTFLFHTADDPGVPVENSMRFAAALRRAGVPFALHIYAHGPHGVGMANGVASAPNAPHLTTWPPLLLDWLTDWRS